MVCSIKYRQLFGNKCSVIYQGSDSRLITVCSSRFGSEHTVTANRVFKICWIAINNMQLNITSCNETPEKTYYSL